MARYNSVVTTTSISGAQSLSSPLQGLLTTLSGTAPYTVNLPSPAQFIGVSQTFLNSAGGNVTLQIPSGVFQGPGSSGTTQQILPNLATITLISNGTNVIVSGSTNAYTDQLVTGQTTYNLLTSTATTVNAFTASSTLNIGASSGTLSLNNPTVTFGGGSTLTFMNTSAPTTVNMFGASTAITIGSNASNATFTIQSTKAATNTTTGALVVGGGIAANGAIYGTQIWENTSRLTSIGKAIAMALVFGG